MQFSRVLTFLGTIFVLSSTPAWAQASQKLFFTGSACATCTVPYGSLPDNTPNSVSCMDQTGQSVVNTLTYDPNSSQIMVNNAYVQCSTNQTSPPAVSAPSGDSGSCPPLARGNSNWIRADNNNGTLVNLACNVNAQLTLYGSALQTCSLNEGKTPYQLSYNCQDGHANLAANTVIFQPYAPQITINGSVYACSTDRAVSPGNPPPGTNNQAWIWADNANGNFSNVSCNIPPVKPTPAAFSWTLPQANVYDDGTQNGNLLETLSGMTLETAKQHANDADYVSYFYFADTDGPNLQAGQAAFFSGIPAPQVANGTSLYVKQASPLSQNLGQGIYAYYSFDVSADDDSGQGNHAALTGNALFEDGHNGNAIRFSTTADPSAQVALPAMATPPAAGFGFALWVKPESGIVTTGTNNLASIMGPLYFNTSTNQIVYQPANSAFALTSPTSSPITTDQWTHVAVTYNAAANQEDMYINGTLSVSASNVSGLNFAPWGSTIGGTPATVTPPYAVLAGAVDEVFLYSRPLQAGEIQFLGGFKDSNRRSFYPQSEDNMGTPGYPPKAECDDWRIPSWFRSGCFYPAWYCSGEKVTAGTSTCNCSPGYALNPSTGAGCVQVSQDTTPAMTITDINQGNLPGKDILLTNATYAIIKTVPRDVLPSQKRIGDLRRTACPSASKPTPTIQEACKMLASGNDDDNKDAEEYTCAKLGMSQNVPTNSNEKPFPILNYPNFNIQEWGSEVRKVDGAPKEFAVINTNFWDTNNTSPCGVPLGLVTETNGNSSAYKQTYFGSMIIRRPKGASESFINFFDQGTTIPATGDPTSAISGHFLRFNKQDASPDTMSKWRYGDYNGLTGRTAVGYSVGTDTMRFIVLPGPNSKSGTGKGLKAKDVRNLFDKNTYDYVLLLDGSGSSSFDYTKNGKEQGSPLYWTQATGNPMRTLPTALIIAPGP